jgi:hypothetical protein
LRLYSAPSAFYCAFKFHNDSGIANLYSLHSWLGIGTISLYAIQVTHYTPASHEFRKNLAPVLAAVQVD